MSGLYVNYQVLTCFFFLLSSNKHCILLIGWHIYLRAAFIGNYLLPSAFSRGQHVIKEKQYSLTIHWTAVQSCVHAMHHTVYHWCITSWPLYISIIIISLHSTSDSNGLLINITLIFDFLIVILRYQLKSMRTMVSSSHFMCTSESELAGWCSHVPLIIISWLHC